MPTTGKGTSGADAATAGAAAGGLLAGAAGDDYLVGESAEGDEHLRMGEDLGDFRPVLVRHAEK